MANQINPIWTWTLAVISGIGVLGILACHFYVLCKITKRIPGWLAAFIWLYTFLIGIGIPVNYVYSWGRAEELQLSKRVFWIWTSFVVLLAIAGAFFTPLEQWRRWREWK